MFILLKYLLKDGLIFCFGFLLSTGEIAGYTKITTMFSQLHSMFLHDRNFIPQTIG